MEKAASFGLDKSTSFSPLEGSMYAYILIEFCCKLIKNNSTYLFWILWLEGSTNFNNWYNLGCQDVSLWKFEQIFYLFIYLILFFFLQLINYLSQNWISAQYHQGKHISHIFRDICYTYTNKYFAVVVQKQTYTILNIIFFTSAPFSFVFSNIFVWLFL